jgi:serine/threonine protein kinase
MPPPGSTDAFLLLLCKSSLLSEEQLSDYLKRTPRLPRDPHSAARRLVKDGLISTYQADQLLAGRYKGFFILSGQYKVVKPIGRGGMGAVFLCEHLQLRRRVAVKVLHRDAAQDKVTLERFQREARAAAALDHPNIVRVHDVNVSNDSAFLVMEYVEGKNLQQVLDEGPLDYHVAVRYVAQAAAGLQHAHERGIIHRDVKPANLLVDRNGVVKVLDMGLACFLDKEDRLTQVVNGGTILGTADYMSPEQALADKKLDARTDIYSLGVTLYALTCGRAPFKGSTTQKLMAHQMRDAVPAHKVCSRVPKALSAVVAKMMAKKPKDRYDTAADVIEALRPWTDATPPSSASTTERLPLPARRPLPWVRSLVGGAAGLLLVVATILVWLSLARHSPQVVASPNVPAKPTGSPSPPAPDKPVTPPGGTQPAEKERYRLNLDDQKPFLVRIENRQPDGNLTLPDGWSGFCWKDESVAEIVAERVGGSMALGFRNLTGDPSCQLTLNFASVIGNLPAGKKYMLRVEYQAQKDASTTVYLRRGDFSSFASVALRPSDGRWEVAEIAFDQEAESARDLAFVTLANGPTSTVHIRSVKIVERAE